jgi:hypothetical protein
VAAQLAASQEGLSSMETVMYKMLHAHLCFQVPALSWNDVILELDHTEFVVKDRQGVNLLFTALRLGLQNQGFHPEMFPVDFLYRHWKNADGQVM